MAQLVAYGLFLIIAVAMTVISTIVGLFIGNIILFESIGLSIAAGCLTAHFTTIHPAFCLLIAIGAFVGLRFLMNTKIGFWVIGGAMSLLWGLLVAVIVYDGTGKDMIWTYVSWGLVTLVIFILHIRAKARAA